MAPAHGDTLNTAYVCMEIWVLILSTDGFDLIQRIDWVLLKAKEETYYWHADKVPLSFSAFSHPHQYIFPFHL